MRRIVHILVLDRWAAFDAPALYHATQYLIGRRDSSGIFVREYVRPARGDRLLDIGCGPGRLLPNVPDVGEYVGLDPNERYVTNARRRFGGRARFIHGRATRAVLDESSTFDVAVAVGVLHHVDDADALELLHTARRALRPGGRFATLDPCHLATQSRVARFIVDLDRGGHIRTADQYARLIGAVFPSVSTALRHDLLRVPYTHCICVATAGD